MADVFISYARTEHTRVEPMRVALQALGVSVFVDVTGIDAGTQFPEAIDRELRACKAVLGCWSPRYFERRWCMIESRVGLERRVLVPVAITGFAKDAPPADLRFLNFFRLTDWRGQKDHEGWLRTLQAIANLTGRDLGSKIAAQTRQAPPQGAKVCGHCGQLGSKVDAYQGGASMLGGVAALLFKGALNPAAIGKKHGDVWRCGSCGKLNNACPFCDTLNPVTHGQALDDIRCVGCSKTFCVAL